MKMKPRNGFKTMQRGCSRFLVCDSFDDIFAELKRNVTDLCIVFSLGEASDAV